MIGCVIVIIPLKMRTTAIRRQLQHERAVIVTEPTSRQLVDDDKEEEEEEVDNYNDHK